MKKLLLLLVLPTLVLAQEKIGNKIYKYGDIYHAVHGPTVVSFEGAKAKTMNKTLEYFTKAGANIKSLNSLYLPGDEISEDNFVSTLNTNNIETLILIDIIDSSSATMNRTTSSAFESYNATSNAIYNATASLNKFKSNKKVKANSVASSSSVQTAKIVDYTTELSLRLTIFSKKDGFSKPVAVVEGRATNGSPDTTEDQIARRIIQRMAKALEKYNAI